MAGARGKSSWFIGKGRRQASVSSRHIVQVQHTRESSPNQSALRFPYVLAFEPTFVEIRHVETGLMSQVIQGNNLRLLFADTPPSATHAVNIQHNSYYAQQGYNPYHQPPPSAYGRQSLSGQYGSPPPSYGQYPRYSAASGRDEILMVSDDRVLTLHLAAGSNLHVASDAASLASSR